MGRSQKALKNVTTGLVNKMILMFLAFATRTIFIRLLGAEYTGVSSLYTNILSVLSLAEMGIGNVLMFYLYSALKRGEKEEIYGYVQEFKKIYNVIIIVVLSVGVMLIPFLHYIVKSSLNNEELIIYYLLYLINSVASYFVVYRTMVIAADQKSYIQNNCSTFTTIIMYIIQIIYLSVFRNFLGYLIIQVICTIINNLLQNYFACKMYPYLNRTSRRSHTLNVIINKKELFQNIKATFLFKVSDKILDQTDNIIISIMFGTIAVGFYSNYYMIILYLVNFAGIIANGLVASFGNLNAENNMSKSFDMFKVAMLLFTFFGTFCTNCYACIIQDFIPIWVGKQYLLDYKIVIAILVVFYLRMCTNTTWMYRSAMGIFKEVQYINLIAAGINILLSIMLGKIIGIAGVIVATAVARLLTSFWYEGKIIFKKFEKPLSIYFKLQFKDFIVSFCIISLSYYICNKIMFDGILEIVCKLLICSFITVIGEIVTNLKRPEFSILSEKICNTMRKDKK